MQDLFGLTDRVAMVTGANTGLGQAMAIALARAGAAVAAVGRTDPDDTLARIHDAGGSAVFVRADLATTAELPRAVDDVERSLAPVDVLVNNAGIIRRADALEFAERDWDDVMSTNLKTPFFLSQRVAQRMVARGSGGKIINVASMLSFQGGIRVASYTASKSGLAGLTHLLANEWAAKGINVNAIAPGYIATSNTEALRNDERRNAEIVSRIPAGRWGVPDDLAGAVVFLASAASDYVHGTVLPVDGGWLSR